MFHSARLKLTLWYTLIIMLISVSFSAVIYQSFAREIDRFAQVQRLRIEQRLQNQFFFTFGDPDPFAPLIDPDLILNLRHRVLFILLVVNGSILVVSAGLAYFLAGRTLQPIQAMVDEQNRFISDASHELKTPLTALKVSMEVFLRDKKTSVKEARTIVQDSLEDVNHLQSLSESLLELAALKKPNTKTTFASLNLTDIINRALKQVSPLAKKKHIKLEPHITETEIVGNEDSLTRLLVIILDNAIKYSPQKSAIQLSSHTHDNALFILLQDHGIGMSQEELDHIYDRFYRADKARTKSDASGFGLGLSIAKEIVALHQGSLHLASKPSQGTLVTIRLPLSKGKIQSSFRKSK